MVKFQKEIEIAEGDIYDSNLSVDKCEISNKSSGSLKYEDEDSEYYSKNLQPYQFDLKRAVLL